MTFCIITHVIHTQQGNQYFGYAPYVNEMNIWIKNANKIIIVAPLQKKEVGAIMQPYAHNNIEFIEVPHFSFTSFKNTLFSLLVIPSICFRIAMAMKKSDHIHLRCPGNMGLLGSWIQIFFPSKRKTAKYAGNWDANAKQPLSYKIQRRLLSNTFLTKKMQVLVYGEWENQSLNVKPFFTATYAEEEKTVVEARPLNSTIHFIFVGTLTSGKRPIYAIQLVESLHKKGFNVQLDLYGEGKEKSALQNYIQENNCHDFITLKGNVARDAIKNIYQKSHFLILPSQSEGWPKVVAEAMFWGCLPIATPISCVANMLDHQKRGLLLALELDTDVRNVEQLINNSDDYKRKINNGINWSRQFTIDKFESEIKKLLQE